VVRARGARRIVIATPLAATDVAAVRAAGAQDVIALETMPGPVALRLHDSREEPSPPLGDAEIHDLIARELRAVGVDPFDGLAIDGI